MRLYFDLDKQALVTALGQKNVLTALDFRRGDDAVLEVLPCRDGVVATTAGESWQFGLKQSGKYDGEYVAYIGTFTGPDSDGYYTGYLDTNTVTINSLLGSGNSPTTSDDVASVTLMGELVRTVSSKEVSCKLLTVTVYNDVCKGSEGTPTTGTPAYVHADKVLAHLYEYTSLTGGTGVDLDSEATLTRNVGRLVCVYISSTACLLYYRLTSGTNAESVPWVIRPDDYAASTNEKVWKLQAAFKQGTPMIPHATVQTMFHRAFVDTIGGIPQLIIESGEVLE